jgi:peptide/nickel transport system ATP-binding protein
MLHSLQDKLRMSVLLITHDLGVVAECAEHVLVMYAGNIVESAPVAQLFAHPRHPYTRGLLGSVPNPQRLGKVRGRLATIEGMVPDLRHLPVGCRFAERCPLVIPACTAAEPKLLPVMGDDDVQLARCIRAREPVPTSDPTPPEDPLDSPPASPEATT